MRHAKKRLQLNRFTSWHDATINSLARAIILNQSIKTTLHRAKASRQTVEQLITLAKTNTLFARRQAQKLLGEHKLVNLLFNELGPRFSKRQSGFTRIIGMGKRRGDNAEMVIFELTEIKKKEAKPVKHAKETKAIPAQNTEGQAEEKTIEEPNKAEPKPVTKEHPAKGKKPQTKFISGIRSIFKKKSDSL
ncbi:MAG: 50S ribosomal protein L17 [Candidatus Omnitrophica bacterium]|nr:50S ribosomal protein L17 [Candidatus Omnitrophota bacterium]